MRFFSAILLSLTMVFAASAISEGVKPEATAPAETKQWRKDLNQSLDKIENRIEQLQSETHKLSGNAKNEWLSTLEDLKKHRDRLKKDLAESKTSTAEKAREFWGRLKAAVGELEKGVDQAGEKIRGQK